MTTESISRGTVLGGRYRLDDLLSENAGARFWRGADTVLGRSVAVNVMPADDARLPGLLAAARDSARVTDAHLLRVLDCAEDKAVGWVVNEWGEGASLDILLQQGPLPPARAAWLAREVADLLANAHRAGVAHGRLSPEAVLVTHTGSVKVIGFAVSAAIEGTSSGVANPVQRGYGEHDPFESDVINLTGVLYCSLTGRWPGLAPSEVTPAPYDARGPLRPRQVRAGVPRMLDAICERVLRKEGHEHLMPLESAYEVFAALSEHLGDPGEAAPETITSMHREPASTGELDRIRDAIAGAARVTRYQRQGPGALPTGIEPTAAPEDPAADDAVFADDDGVTGVGLPAHPGGPAVTYGGFDPNEQPAPLPPFVDSPERPLFADTVASRQRPAPSEPSEPSDTAAEPGDADAEPDEGAWPFGEDGPGTHEASNHADRDRTHRSPWLLLALISLVATAVVVAGLILVFD